ncbi:MAG: ATP-binding protein [Candidatus Methanomethylicaceae archaeon]
MSSSDSQDFDPARFVDKNVPEIKRIVGSSKAAIATSGGVDSTVCAVLALRALGDRLICFFMDTGFMREGEVEEVRTMLTSLGLPFKVLTVEDRFLRALEGKTDAESKRLAFRDTFYTILGEAVKGEGCEILIQGTIAPDWIETSGGIKTQHNVLEQLGVNTMSSFGFKLLEPLLDLYKDQVRALARYLGVEITSSNRQPFPGPGLLVRCIGTVKEDKLDVLKKATFIVEDHLRQIAPPPQQYLAAIVEDDRTPAGRGIDKILSKVHDGASAYYLAGRATGVKGDDRAYGKMIVVSGIEEEPKDLFEMPEKVVHADREIVRVLYSISDNSAKSTRKKRIKRYFVIVRAVDTRDFMTAKPSAVSLQVLQEIAKGVLKDKRVVAVAYDLTSKPPATVEFE